MTITYKGRAAVDWAIKNLPHERLVVPYQEAVEHRRRMYFKGATHGILFTTALALIVQATFYVLR